MRLMRARWSMREADELMWVVLSRRHRVCEVGCTAALSPAYICGVRVCVPRLFPDCPGDQARVRRVSRDAARCLREWL